MNFFECLANDWADITDLSSSGSDFHKQLPLNLMDLYPRELYARGRLPISGKIR